jgi:DNA polymerase-3 subunit beta
MQTTIIKKDFINALTIGGAMAGKNKTLPILDSAKVEVSADTLTIHSFNGESWVSKDVHVEETDGDFAFCINPSELAKALKSLAEEVVTFVIEGSVMVINHFKGSMELPILASDQFPLKQIVEDGVNAKLNVTTIKEWLAIASDFVAQDELRPVMGGMYIYSKEGKLGVCATDAHKLWHDSVDYNGEEFGVILPASGFKPLLSMLEGSDEIGVAIGEKNISFTTTNSALHCRLIEGVYPNFKAVIPTNNHITVKVAKSELADSVGRVGLFANKATSLLKLSVGAKSMGIEGSDVDLQRKANEVVKSEGNSESLNIGVKGDFFSTCLSHIISEDVVLRMSDPTRPIVFEDDAEPSKVMLVMPMIIN